mgnify:CR=1 FL=1
MLDNERRLLYDDVVDVFCWLDGVFCWCRWGLLGGSLFSKSVTGCSGGTVELVECTESLEDAGRGEYDAFWW